jgi:beta-N-acetylhexosaminidase
MTLSPDFQLFGNHLIAGVSGTKLNDDDKRILSTLKPVGVIFFAKNFQDGIPYEVWLETYKNLLQQVREYSDRSSMFITIDHEGGRVIRPPLPITRFPYAFLQRQLAHEVGKATAIELKSLGINVSWAPIADIFSNPQNPIIAMRSFGTTPETAAQGAIEYYLGLKENGILSCAKHFPGHGDTSKDSHLELPMLDLSQEELQSRELIPFKALIDQQIPLIMTAHILFPKIDTEVPATLSYPILQTILREKLGFEGVVVSDDLDMKAVSQMFMESGTVAQAVNAGCDLFIVSRNINSLSVERTFAIAQDYITCLANGTLKESVAEASRARINKLLAQTPQYSVEKLSQNTFKRHGELAIACSFQDLQLPESLTVPLINEM